MRARRFVRDESAQSLVFAALTLFGLVVMALMILGVGENTSIQIRLQNAADAAAYSGAQVQADCLAHIAWMNEGMSHIYYDCMRHCVDVSTLAVLTEMANFQPNDDGVNPEGWDPVNAGFPSTNAQPADIGIDDVAAKYVAAYDTAKDAVPRGEWWLRRLWQLERGLSALGPGLVEHQIFYTASANGADRICYFPGFEFLPSGPTKIDVNIEKIGNFNPAPWQPNGWKAWCESPQFDLEAMHQHHAMAMDDVWKEQSKASILNDLYNFYSWTPPNSKGWHEGWDVSLSQGGDTRNIEVRARYSEWGKTRPADYYVRVEGGGTPPADEEAIAHVDADGNVTVLKGNIFNQTTGSDAKGDYKLTVTADGWMVIDYKDGSSTAIKYNKDGVLCEWDDIDKDGKRTDDEMKPIHDATSVDVNGNKLPLDFNPNIQIGGVTVNINQPIRIHLQGLTVVFANPLQINYSTPAGEMYFRDDHASINGLSTKSADGKWRRIGHSRNQQQHDRTRHRMLEMGTAEWLYEWVRIGAYLDQMKGKHPNAGPDACRIEMNRFLRFAVHSVMDRDTDYINNSGPDRWRMPQKDDDETWEASGETVDSQWKFLPTWGRPFRDAIDEPAPQVWGGWFNMATGKPMVPTDYPEPYNQAKPTDALNFGTAFSQTRECWYCGKVGDAGLPARIYDANEDPATRKPYQRPCGFWHVRTTENSAEDARLSALEAKYPVVINRFGPLDPNNPYPGRVTFQFDCPVCKGRRYLFDNPSEDCQNDAPPFYKLGSQDIHDIPTKARRYLYHAIGRCGQAALARSDAAANRKWDGGDTALGSDASTRDFFSIHMNVDKPTQFFGAPLELTSELFRNSITVMAYAPRAEAGIWSTVTGSEPSDQHKQVGIMNPLQDPDWGHYAMTTARVFVAKPEPIGDTVKLMTNFSWNGPAILGEDSLDPIERQKNWNRQRYLRGLEFETTDASGNPMTMQSGNGNLFEPGWTAAIAPISKAIDPRDYYTEDELLSGAITDNSTSLILRLLRSSYWRKSIIDSGYGWHNRDASPVQGWNHMHSPPMQRSAQQVALSEHIREESREIARMRSEEGNWQGAIERTRDLREYTENKQEQIQKDAGANNVNWDDPEIEEVVHH